VSTTSRISPNILWGRLEALGDVAVEPWFPLALVPSTFSVAKLQFAAMSEANGDQANGAKPPPEILDELGEESDEYDDIEVSLIGNIILVI
jgi:hypothetical protein